MKTAGVSIGANCRGRIFIYIFYIKTTEYPACHGPINTCPQSTSYAKHRTGILSSAGIEIFANWTLEGTQVWECWCNVNFFILHVKFIWVCFSACGIKISIIHQRTCLYRLRFLYLLSTSVCKMFRVEAHQNASVRFPYNTNSLYVGTSDVTLLLRMLVCVWWRMAA